MRGLLRIEGFVFGTMIVVSIQTVDAAEQGASAVPRLPRSICLPASELVICSEIYSKNSEDATLQIHNNTTSRSA